MKAYDYEGKLVEDLVNRSLIILIKRAILHNAPFFSIS